MKKVILCISLLLIMICPFALCGCSENKIVPVVSIELTSSIDNEDTYTITYSDGTKDYFIITNGEQGIQGVKGDDGHSPIVTIGSNGNWFIDGVDSKQKAQGPKGDTGVGILSIVKTGSNGLIDTYTITFTDNSTTTFTVTNGHTPIITIGSNGNWFIDGIDSNQQAQGLQGLSAYELYIKNNPEYTKSEQEWLNDLAAGHLATVTLTFDTDGGNNIEAQTIGFGTYATTNPQPKKDGYIFKSWTLNGSEIDLNTFTFFTDSSLVAKYVPKEFDITLNPDGGSVAYNTIHIQYGESYTMPIAAKDYKSFANWKLGEVVIPNSGIWTYSKSSVQLKAYYNTTQIFANLSSDESYGTIDTKRVKLIVGDNYTLPIPTEVEGGLSFQGWFNGDIQYTDKNGQSLTILKDTSTIDLTASYYTEINNVYQIIAMGSAESTTGNFVITQDLDFSGLEMTPINNFSGVFDGGGHTLSNITINRGNETCGGFFGRMNLSATIKNINFSKLNLYSGYGGLIGHVIVKTDNFELNISNISFTDSLNNCGDLSNAFGVLIGSLTNTYSISYHSSNGYSSSLCNVNINNIKIINSGNSLPDNSSFAIGSVDNYKVINGSSYGNYKMTYYYPMMIAINNYFLNSSTTLTGEKYGILSKFLVTSETDENLTRSYTYGDKKNQQINISNFENHINGLASTISNTSGITITVSKSKNYGNCEKAWGGVTKLENSINVGVCSGWGAELSVNCFDIAEKGEYFYNNTYKIDNIKNSFILFENADGSYYCFTSSGELSVVGNITLITKEWFVSFLSFDESIWNLDDFDLSENIYPTLKGA